MQAINIPPEIQVWLWNLAIFVVGALVNRYFPNLLPFLPKPPAPAPQSVQASDLLPPLASKEQFALQLFEAGETKAALILLGRPTGKA